MSTRKYIEEKLDNITKKELAKYKSFNAAFNEPKVNVTLSNGAKVKVQETNLDKISIFGSPYKSIIAPEAADFIAAPKFVRNGRFGYTTYVEPVIGNAQEEFNKGY